MRSHDASAAPGLSGPDEGDHGAMAEEKLAEAQGSETPARLGTREVGVTSTVVTEGQIDGAGSGTPLRVDGDGTPLDGSPLLLAPDHRAELLADPVREVDRRNGNAARARKQALKEPEMVEDSEGNVHHLKAKSLAIPEDKRCQALTVHGVRCKAGKMRGMEVCVFHSHRALSDDALATIIDPEAKPRLTPRKALKAVVALRAGELAEAAVGGALDSDGIQRTRAVLALIDAVDPLQTEEGQITLTSEGAATATWSQMRAIFNPS